MRKSSLLIAGDLVPTESNIELFTNSNISKLLGKELLSLWKESDLRITNLEAPLTEDKSPIEKCGPNLRIPTCAIDGIKALDLSLITLANNHILDQGENGLRSTMHLLSENNIPFIGVGSNIKEASKAYIIEKNGVKIGVYACAEYEFSIVMDDQIGANPFDPLESLDHIKELKYQVDYVVVLYHGGKEHYRYPSPYLQKVCRKMCEKGADLIVCQHSHCIGCAENYKDSTIVYGQGNFIFDDLDNEFWNTSLLIQINIDNGFSIEYIPIVKEQNCIRIASDDESKSILLDFNKRSRDILNEGFVNEEYNNFAKGNMISYLRAFSGFGKWMSRIDRRLFKNKLINTIYDRKKILTMQNFIMCEAHRELVLAGLKGEKRRGRKEYNK